MAGSARLAALRALLRTGLLCGLACGDGGSGGSGVDDPTRFRVTFGGAGDERAAQVHALDEGSLVVATRAAEEGAGAGAVWLFRTEELLSDLAAARGGDLLGVGREGLVVRLRPDGVERWRTVFPRAEGSAVRPPVDLVERSDAVLSSIGRYIVDAVRGRDSSALLLEVEVDGGPRTQRVERSLPLGEFVVPVALAAPRDGGLLVASHGTRSGILRLGADDEERWGRVLAEGLLADLAATSDGGFVAVGSTEPYFSDTNGLPTPSDLFLLRSDADGNIDPRWLATDAP